MSLNLATAFVILAIVAATQADSTHYSSYHSTRHSSHHATVNGKVVSSGSSSSSYSSGNGPSGSWSRSSSTPDKDHSCPVGEQRVCSDRSEPTCDEPHPTRPPMRLSRESRLPTLHCCCWCTAGHVRRTEDGACVLFDECPRVIIDPIERE